MMYGWGTAGILMVAVWIVVAAGVLWLLAGLVRRDGGRSARLVLDERFAAGEISQEEYEARRRVLG